MSWPYVDVSAPASSAAIIKIVLAMGLVNATPNEDDFHSAHSSAATANASKALMIMSCDVGKIFNCSACC